MGCIVPQARFGDVSHQAGDATLVVDPETSC
jgi:hypothetical protein